MSGGSRDLVVAITGASGSVLGARIVEMLAEVPDVNTHLVVTSGGRATMAMEMPGAIDRIEDLADHVYRSRDTGCRLASGSFRTIGMIIAPCSIKTLSAVANSYSSNLVSRAADVTLKERRPLLLALREAPLHAGHLRMAADLSALGAIIHPPVPAFYLHPKSVDELVDDIAARVLDQFDIDVAPMRRWDG